MARDDPRSRPRRNAKPQRLSPFARKAAAHHLRHRIRARAPRHPKAPEARLRLVTTKLFTVFHTRVKARFKHAAPQMLARKLQRRDASQNDPLLASAFHDLWSYALTLLHGSAFRRIVDAAAKATANSVAAQTKQALDLNYHEPNLDKHVEEFSSDVVERMQDLMGDSIQRGADILEEWTELDETRSKRAGDMDSLDGMLDDGLDGISGKALASAGVLFGMAFADMVRSSQQDAGVSTYMWHSQLDSHVRPEHAALDGKVCSWDDPPLSAAESDSGEECHPGEDFNCRCTADPMDPDELN